MTAFVILSEDSLFPRPDLIHIEMIQDTLMKSVCLVTAFILTDANGD